MRVQAMTAAAMLALTAAACSPAEKAPPAPAEAEAPLPPGRPAIYQAGERDAEAFVRALYADLAVPRTMTTGRAVQDIPPRGRDPIYSRTMNALIGEDFRAAKGEVPTLNYDPLCACQDTDGFALKSVTMTPDGPKAASAEVVFTNLDQTWKRTLKLVKEGPMWRVADVIDDKGQSLHDELMAVVEKAGG